MPFRPQLRPPFPTSKCPVATRVMRRNLFIPSPRIKKARNTPPNQTSRLGKYDWIFDSGAACHVCPNRDMFTEYQVLERPREMVGCGTGFFAVGIGTVQLTALHPKGSRQLFLRKVRHVPQNDISIISVDTLTRPNTRYSSVAGFCEFTDVKTGDILLTGTQRPGIGL